MQSRLLPLLLPICHHCDQSSRAADSSPAQILGRWPNLAAPSVRLANSAHGWQQAIRSLAVGFDASRAEAATLIGALEARIGPRIQPRADRTQQPLWTAASAPCSHTSRGSHAPSTLHDRGATSTHSITRTEVSRIAARTAHERLSANPSLSLPSAAQPRGSAIPCSSRCPFVATSAAIRPRT